MSRESDFATRMRADATLMAILTGGVYTREDAGPEGISRETTPAAFDSNGYLKPCAFVKQRGLVPDGEVTDEGAKIVSARLVVEVWLYQRVTYTAIDGAKARLYALFQGHQFTGASACAPLRWLGVPVSRERDPAALKGASMERVDFLVVALQKAA